MYPCYTESYFYRFIHTGLYTKVTSLFQESPEAELYLAHGQGVTGKVTTSQLPVFLKQRHHICM